MTFEQEFVLDALQDALTECELSDQISQGVIDKLTVAIKLMQGESSGKEAQDRDEDFAA